MPASRHALVGSLSIRVGPEGLTAGRVSRKLYLELDTMTFMVNGPDDDEPYELGPGPIIVHGKPIETLEVPLADACPSHTIWELRLAQ